MRPAKQDPGRHPTLVGPSIDPSRILTEASPVRGTASKDDVVSLERSIPFGGSGIELQYPARLVWPPPWIGHIPFALWLVEALRPRVIVELGVHSGNSYCAFLQAVQSLALTTQCYGIDHWRGDEHADHYGDDVYAELCSYHDPLYGTFSTLLRATFEEALPYFADRSIDLLHIDGFHSYRAVEKDFSEWLPKMSPCGVVLFHDISVREREFGVWQFWEEEIATRYQTLTFLHSHGLGLAYVGSDPPPASLRSLLDTSDSEALGRIRAYFARLGTSLIDRFGRRQSEGAAGRIETNEAGKVAILRAEMARRTEAAAKLQQDLFAASRAEASRQAEAIAGLQQELTASRAEAARLTDAARAFEAQCAEARSEVARLTDAARVSRADARKATERIALMEDELEAARAEIARERDAADASRAATEEVHGQVVTLGDQLSRARNQTSEAIAQRERATQLLRQQIAATAALQREVAAHRQNPALAAVVNRLASVKHLIPKPVKRYIKHRILGLRS
jgi:Methyltransferase domain